MRSLGIAAALLALLFAFPAAAASVEARVDLSAQRMYVKVNGVNTYVWPVSTARRGYRTPTGTFRPQRLERTWYSSKYDNSPMPYSVFFLGGYAIHGTNAIGSLGRPVSHGCVRLHPSNAAKLYSLIQRYGMGNARVIVTQ
jgi:lipoprotein-anchoring transpeptidase ErfK/SrfK